MPYDFSRQSKNVGKYAENHRGVVLRFECLRDNSFLAAQQVKYFAEAPTYGSKQEWLKFLREENAFDYRRMYYEFIVWKSLDWSYEDEWRIILPSGKDKGKAHTSYAIAQDEISNVFLGKDMQESKRTEIRGVVKNKFPQAKLIELAHSN